MPILAWPILLFLSSLGLTAANYTCGDTINGASCSATGDDLFYAPQLSGAACRQRCMVEQSDAGLDACCLGTEDGDCLMFGNSQVTRTQVNTNEGWNCNLVVSSTSTSQTPTPTVSVAPSPSSSVTLLAVTTSPSTTPFPPRNPFPVCPHPGFCYILSTSASETPFVANGTMVDSLIPPRQDRLLIITTVSYNRTDPSAFTISGVDKIQRVAYVQVGLFEEGSATPTIWAGQARDSLPESVVFEGASANSISSVYVAYIDFDITSNFPIYNVPSSLQLFNGANDATLDFSIMELDDLIIFARGGADPVQAPYLFPPGTNNVPSLDQTFPLYGSPLYPQFGGTGHLLLSDPINGSDQLVVPLSCPTACSRQYVVGAAFRPVQLPSPDRSSTPSFSSTPSPSSSTLPNIMSLSPTSSTTPSSILPTITSSVVPAEPPCDACGCDLCTCDNLGGTRYNGTVLIHPDGATNNSTSTDFIFTIYDEDSQTCLAEFPVEDPNDSDGGGSSTTDTGQVPEFLGPVVSITLPNGPGDEDGGNGLPPGEYTFYLPVFGPVGTSAQCSANGLDVVTYPTCR